MKYFPHDSDSFEDEKITMLFSKFGFEGLGLFYTILEKMAKQEKPINGEVLKHQLRIGKGFGMKGKRLEKCWIFMEQLQIIQQTLDEHLKTSGEYFNNRLQTLIKHSCFSKEQNKNKVSKWREKQLDIKSVTGNVPVRNPHNPDDIYIKEKKEEESNGYNNDDDERTNEIFRQFKNLVGKNYTDDFLKFQAKKLINKNPEIIAKKAGALVNSWAGRITQDDFLQWQKSNEKTVVDESKFITLTHPELNEW